ncbi:hypothetical protein ACWC09_17945 [Streptomyces sp. NPDC001617]
MKVHPKVLLLAVGLAAAAVGCSSPASSPDIRMGAPPLKFCGVTFWHAAMGIGAADLTHSTRAMPAAPTDGWSHLPAHTHASSLDQPPPDVVRVTDDCSHGRTVVVTPAASVRIRTVAEDRAGRVVALSLVPAKTGATVRVHIYAYDGSRPVGQLLTTVS